MFSTTKIKFFARVPYIYSYSSSSIKNSKDFEKPTQTVSSRRIEEFREKLRQKTPIGKLDEIVGTHPNQEKEPLKPFPNATNPISGEIGGPKGPEPTRYGDWERKGRVTDF